MDYNYKAKIVDTIRFAGYLVLHLVPPWLLLYIYFGTFSIGTVLMMVPAVGCSLAIICFGLLRERHSYLLGPCLVLLSEAIITMAIGHSMKQITTYSANMANIITAQCNRDGFCSVPERWENKSTLPGFISFELSLQLYNNEVPGASNKGTADTDTKFNSFKLKWGIEDFDYCTYGGVGKEPELRTET